MTTNAFHNLLGLVDEDHPQPCRFIEFDVCQFDRVGACYAEPWNRMKEGEGNVYIYRFVDHSFESVP